MLPLALCEKHTNIIPESQPKKRDKEERNRKEKGSRIEDNLPEGIACHVQCGTLFSSDILLFNKLCELRYRFLFFFFPWRTCFFNILKW